VQLEFWLGHARARTLATGARTFRLRRGRLEDGCRPRLGQPN
jgi:hypothetical protein